MNILPAEYQVKIIDDRLATERNEDGSRQTFRQFTIEWMGEQYTVERGFHTDFSSYPRDGILWGVPLVLALIFGSAEFLWYWLIPILWPAWWRVDVTGVVHDKSWRDSSWGMSLFKGNLLFLCCALSGDRWQLRANLFQGLVGYLCLTVVAILKTIKIKITN